MNQLAPYATLVLRLAVGGVFLRHGIMKLDSGVTATAAFLRGVGLPFAELWALVLIAIETVGAACVLLGVWTRLWAAVMAVEMVVAILAVRVRAGAVFELEALLFAGALALVALGDGPVSVGLKFRKS
jgi:putative oxidoreductase